MLRKRASSDKFVEFFGDGLANLSLRSPSRATIANMAPGHGSALWPVRSMGDGALSGALGHAPPRALSRLVSATTSRQAQGMRWRNQGAQAARYTDERRARPGTVVSGQPRRAEPAAPDHACP